MKRFGTCMLVMALSAASPVLAQGQFGTGMRSVKMAVNDFKKTILFYTALGMKAGTNRGATQDLIWEGGATMNSGILMAGPDYAGRKDIVRGGNYLMIMAPDIKAVADRLRRAGFPAGEPRAMGTQATVLMLKDPDGNHIELLGPAPAK